MTHLQLDYPKFIAIQQGAFVRLWNETPAYLRRAIHFDFEDSLRTTGGNKRTGVLLLGGCVIRFGLFNHDSYVSFRAIDLIWGIRG